MPKPGSEYGGKNLTGKRIMRLREEKGKSQRELAHELQLTGLDIDKNVITRIETNKRYASDFEMKEFKEYCDFLYYYLIESKK